MSAFARTVAKMADESDEPISVLIALPPLTDPSSISGLMAVLTKPTRPDGSQLFTFQTCGADEEHARVAPAIEDSARPHFPVPVMSLTDAAADPLTDFDILVLPHLTGDAPESATGESAAPSPLHRRRKSYTNADTIATSPEDMLAAVVTQWANAQSADNTRERSLLTIGAGTLSAARAGALRRLAASIHPSLLTRLELECQAATLASNPDEERTRVIDAAMDPDGGWYVVSNGRFDLESEFDRELTAAMAAGPDAAGSAVIDDLEDSLPSPSTGNRRMSGQLRAIPGSDGRRYSRRRSSISRRQSLPLGGLRVITAAEPAAATDSALYLVAAMHSVDRAREIAGGLGHEWRKGMAVGAVDV